MSIFPYWATTAKAPQQVDIGICSDEQGPSCIVRLCMLSFCSALDYVNEVPHSSCCWDLGYCRQTERNHTCRPLPLFCPSVRRPSPKARKLPKGSFLATASILIQTESVVLLVQYLYLFPQPLIPIMALTIARRSLASAALRQATRATVSRAFSSNLTPDKSHYVQSRAEAPYKLGKHRSNALEMIKKQPVIEVDGDMAVCDGGGGALGHPLEYIKVGPRADYGQGMAGVMNEEDGVPCIYCGLRYRKKKS